MRPKPELDSDFHAMNCRIGARIRRARVSAGIPRQLIAAAAGISIQQLQKYETGSNAVTAGRLYRIGKVLGVSPASLLSDDGSEAPSISEHIELSVIFEAISEHEKRRRVLNMVRAAVANQGTGEA